MSARDDAAERARQQRENERELKKIHFYYRSLTAEEQSRIDSLARRAAELDVESRGGLIVDWQLAPIARMHKLASPSCALAREKHRRWMEILREDHGKRIEDTWRDRLDRLAGGEAA